MSITSCFVMKLYLSKSSEISSTKSLSLIETIACSLFGASEYLKVTDDANFRCCFALEPRKIETGPTKSLASSKISPGNAIAFIG